MLCIVLFLLPLLLTGATNYALDPLHVYRAKEDGARFWWDQRSQNAGKIRSYLPQGYDGVIIGNSVADNFLPSDVSRELGWGKVMKLTMAGGYASEQAMTLEAALQHAPITHVLWCIRPWNFIGDSAEAWHPTRAIPVYLYTDSIADDAPYLFSLDTLRFSIGNLLGKPSGKWLTDLERLNYWMDIHIKDHVTYSSDCNLDKLASEDSNATSFFRIAPSRPSEIADNTLLRIPLKHPDIQFEIIFAPMHLQWIRGLSAADLEKYFGIQKYIVARLASLPNVSIHGFETDSAITSNLANYRDALHFGSGVNLRMLKAVAEGRNRLTAANLDVYLAHLARMAADYSAQSDFVAMIPFRFASENEALLAARGNASSPCR